MMKFLLGGWGKTIIVGLTVSIAFGLGYKAASHKFKAEALDRLEALRIESQKRYDKDLEILMASQEVLVETKKVIRYVDREIPTVETPECTRLGADWLRLYNSSIKAGNLHGPSELSD